MITPKLTLPEAAPAADREAASKKYVDDNRASPIYINMLTTAPSAVGQGEWIRSINSIWIYGAAFFNNSLADGDNFSVIFSCTGGVYNIDINAPKNANNGKIDVFIDSDKIADGVDLYAGSAELLNMLTIADVEISSGSHVLKIAVNGKNASSGNYVFITSGISLTRTGDLI
jgi:hypothetical protein